jgi:hypothetical protein
MKTILNKAAQGVQQFRNQLDGINTKIAASLKGRMVCVQVGGQPPARGIVVGVLLENGAPKILVNGTCYDLRHVLTVTPAQLN